MEAVKVRHLSLQLGELYLSIDLICQEYWFLLMNVRLVCRHLYEEVISRYACSGTIYAGRSALLLLWATALSGIRIRVCSNRYLQGLRSSIRTCYRSMGSRNHKSTCLPCQKNVGIGY